MAGPDVQNSAAAAGEETVGDLVSLAVRDITQLFKCELDLAKIELRADARRLGLGAGLAGAAAFTGCLVLMLLCFAFAFGLNAAGIWLWASFLIVAGTCVLLAALAVLIAYLKVRSVTGLERTRTTVQDDLTLLRGDDGPAARSGPAAV